MHLLGDFPQDFLACNILKIHLSRDSKNISDLLVLAKNGAFQ